MKLIGQKTALLFYVLVIVLVFLYFTFICTTCDAEDIASVISSSKGWSVFLLLAMHLVRGFFLLPSTPLVLASALVFPENPIFALSLSVLSIIATSSVLYYIARRGISIAAIDQGTKVFVEISEALKSKYGILYVMGWSFFPAVPTDLICYAAGLVRMRFAPYIVALGVGELILCATYIFGASYFLSLF